MMYFVQEGYPSAVADAARTIDVGTQLDSPVRSALAGLPRPVDEDDPTLLSMVAAYFAQFGYRPDFRGAFDAAVDLYWARVDARLVHPAIGAGVIVWHGQNLRSSEPEIEATTSMLDNLIDRWATGGPTGRLVAQSHLLGQARAHLRRVSPQIPWVPAEGGSVSSAGRPAAPG